MEAVHQLEADLEKGKRGCGEACCWLLLGAIIREKKKHKIDDTWASWPYTPFHGLSLEESKKVVMSFKTPGWCSQKDSYGHSYSHTSHGCTLIGLLQPQIDETWKSLAGFQLEPYIYKHNKAV